MEVANAACRAWCFSSAAIFRGARTPRKAGQLANCYTVSAWGNHELPRVSTFARGALSPDYRKSHPLP